MESRQAEIDFTKEQLANLRLRLDSAKVVDPIKSENELDTKVEEKMVNEMENQIGALKLRVADLESQLKSSQANVCRHFLIVLNHLNVNRIHVFLLLAFQMINSEIKENPIGFKISEMERLQGNIMLPVFVFVVDVQYFVQPSFYQN